MTVSTLSELQLKVLDAFFALESRFFLTGGAALAGFHLGHRTTEDLDLFTEEALLKEGEGALSKVAEDFGATLEKITSSPYFVRFLFKHGGEGIVIDLVYDRVAQGISEKISVGGIRVDPPQEILANKLCTLLSRAEIRDVVDILSLERSGLRIEDALDLAVRKDSGLTPAMLAWILSQIEISNDATIPGGFSVAEIRTFIDDLQTRFRRLAIPG